MADTYGVFQKARGSNQHEQWPSDPEVACCIQGTIPIPSSMGVLISRYQDPYKPISITGCHKSLNASHVYEELRVEIPWWLLIFWRRTPEIWHRFTPPTDVNRTIYLFRSIISSILEYALEATNDRTKFLQTESQETYKHRRHLKPTCEHLRIYLLTSRRIPPEVKGVSLVCFFFSGPIIQSQEVALDV